MRMYMLPPILLLAACVSVQPPARSYDSYRFHRQRHCEGCEKNDADRRGKRAAVHVPQAESPGNAAVRILRIA